MLKLRDYFGNCFEEIDMTPPLICDVSIPPELLALINESKILKNIRKSTPESLRDVEMTLEKIYSYLKKHCTFKNGANLQLEHEY